MASFIMFWLNVCVISGSFGLVYAGAYVPIDVEIPPNVKKVFTAEEIAQYDGSDVSMLCEVEGRGICHYVVA